MSRFGSTEFATCSTSLSAKTRTTWQITLHSRMFAKNLLPSPSPFEAPAINPAISTNSTVAGTILSESYILPSTCNRLSGTPTIPVLGSMVANG